MKKTLLPLFLLLSLHGLAQKIPNFGIDKIRINEPERTLVFHIKESNKGKLKADRTYYWYAGNQVQQTQGGVGGKVLNGPFAEYYPNKNLKEQGKFKYGLKNGPWQNWTASGVLTDIITWKDGVIDGPFKRFDKQGATAQEGSYAKGKINGKVKIYHSGDSIQIVRYKAGNILLPQNADQ